ncbi:hypothetical protein D3250_08225 [Nesterenkonia natronophila]|uniref:Uncharacterized protein n=1 Tax=Nesterenkonia natronophila TaxID=2174932 RepID=A0A3A4F6F3_9MICC|nr:hypothetical protein D3250_08225 [Nesterenkonia natronophila]
MQEPAAFEPAQERTRGIVEGIFDKEGAPASSQQVLDMLAGMGHMLEARGVDLGVCRKENPHAKLRFVQSSAGLQICCTHAPPHCSEM